MLTRGEQRKAFLLMLKIQEQDRAWIDYFKWVPDKEKRKERDGNQYGELREIYNELKGALNV